MSPSRRSLGKLNQNQILNSLYNRVDVDLDQVVSVNLIDSRIKKILTNVLMQSDLEYEIFNKQIVLRKKAVDNTVSPEKETTVKEQVGITGSVTDADGQPLPGASVLERGTSNGTQTDFDGNFTLEVTDENAVLVVSYIGFTTQEVPVLGKSQVNIVLQVNAAGLDEVVVVGYGTQAKRAITSSVTSVKIEDFNQGNINAPQQLLQGKVSGLSVARPGGNPNEEFSIRLRGISTLGANTQPLIVIDGLAGGSLQSVDPNDIASIDVLKDGGAAAIYGTRGSSGVILITTKRGKANESEFNYNAYVSVESVANSYDVADAQLFASLPNVQSSNIFGASTDWQDEITRSAALGTVHSISASGGSENGFYRASLNYRDIQGIQRFTGFDQLNARFSFDQRALNDKLRFSGFHFCNGQKGEPWL